MGGQSLNLVALLRRYWKLLTVAFLAMLVEGGADLLDPWPLKVIFDYVLGSKRAPSWLSGWLSVSSRTAILDAAAVSVIFIALIGAIYYLAVGRRKTFPPVVTPTEDDAPLAGSGAAPPA